ncbi:MAG: hypothetical protein VW643_05365, partial [Opitutales bacterium]
GYVLVEINSSVESSISFAGLETYLDTNHIQEQGFVDFMPFDFNPVDRIDLNSSSELLATADGYDKIFFQEYNDTQNNKTFWTLSIEHGDDEVNASSLVVDMAGFVYNGAFEDYWYHTFGIAVYEPNTEPEQRHQNWNETEFTADSNGVASLYSAYPEVSSLPQQVQVSNLELQENEANNSVIGLVAITIPEIMGDLNFTAYADQSAVSTTLQIEDNGTLRALTSFDYEQTNQVQFVAHVIDEFGRRIQKSFTLLITNQVEDFDGDGVEDHNDPDDDNDTFLDTVEAQYGFDPRNKNDHPQIPIVSTIESSELSSGAYRLAGKIQTDGGVPITEFGINLRKSADSNFVKYSGSSRLSDGSYTLDFGTLDKGQTYYFQAFAANLAGTSLGAIKKFTTNEPQFWWSSATELAGGWRSNWVGEFLPYENGWIYHIDLGWAFVKPDVLGGIWMWVDDEGWLWSSEEAWPFLWASRTKNWLYPMKVGIRTYLYDYQSESIRSR